MSKMGSHDPFGHFKHKLWLKELTIWLPTTKSQESPWFPYVQVACNVPLKSFWKGYNFALDLISIEGLHTKLWTPKIVGVSTLRISRLWLGSPGTKWHLGAGPVAKHIIYYKGEGDGFPEIWAMVSFVSPCLPVVRPCSNYALINLLFSLCRSMWVIELLVNLLGPILELQHTLLPPKCYELKNTPQLLLLPMSSPLDSKLNPSRSLGVHHNHYCLCKQDSTKLIKTIF
jgi:hypothetical protein